MSLGMSKAKVRIEGKPIWYHTDGTGRDTYITRNNGGLMSQQMLRNSECKQKQPDFIPMRLGSSQGFRKQLPVLGTKFVHYHSDGSGRDSYIGWNNGGRTQVYGAKNNIESAFRSTLRSYQRTPSTCSFQSSGSTTYTNRNNFDFSNTNFYLNPKQVDEQNKIHRRQIQSAHRLSRPKTACNPQMNPNFQAVGSHYDLYQTSNKQRITY